jgi:hypothetical protein
MRSRHRAGAQGAGEVQAARSHVLVVVGWVDGVVSGEVVPDVPVLVASHRRPRVGVRHAGAPEHVQPVQHI